MELHAAHRAAVIDIGSNSVRLVVYTIWRSAMIPGFNEKVMAGLGRGLGETGRLSSEGRLAALSALRRFRVILDSLDIEQVRAVATAAVRNASDGAEFAREAALAAGVELSILTGHEEGRLSALGVSASVWDADGLVADLGGSSLELYPVGTRRQRQGESHPLGPFAIARLDDAAPAEIRRHVRKTLAGSVCTNAGARRIYAVGGAWRAFAKVQIAQDRYPLNILQNHAIRADEIPKLVKQIFAARDGKPGAPRISDIAGRRARQLHLTATVLDELVRATGADDVVISAGGLREGVVRDMTGPTRGDPLHDGAVAFARLDAGQVAFGRALHDFLMPVLRARPVPFRDVASLDRLVRLACLLADSGGRFHPDHRADTVSAQMLYAPHAGLSHGERVFVAMALGVRYSRSFTPADRLMALMATGWAQTAGELGHLMRLGADYSARSAELLKRVSLSLGPQGLRLWAGHDAAATISETVERRLGQAGDIMGVSSDIRYT